MFFEMLLPIKSPKNICELWFSRYDTVFHKEGTRKVIEYTMDICFTLYELTKKFGFDENEYIIIRHSGPQAMSEINNGKIMEYTANQPKDYFKGYKYLIVFTACGGNLAVYKKIYEIINANKTDSGSIIYELKELSTMSEYSDRLIVDWGNIMGKNWYLKGKKDKPIVGIIPPAKYQSNKLGPFPGYEAICLKYSQLCELTEDNISHADWHAALSAVYGIYLIVDTSESGKIYVGSAYGNNGGILGRWKVYAETGHGNDKELMSLMANNPERCQSFEFSILQILSKGLSDKQVIEAESQWKNRLHSRQLDRGLNRN